MALEKDVKVFKKNVLKIRDILRSPGVSLTGMDSMRHLCIYLFSRYCTSDKMILSEETKCPFPFPTKLLWNNIIQQVTSNHDPEHMLQLFSSPNPSTITVLKLFQKYFKTSETFRFDITDARKHCEILHVLKDIPLCRLELSFDVLGWVYEQHLATGSSSASRDLGQFFTDRKLTKYMIELCQPKLNEGGIPETCCDPTMGTGGFLTGIPQFLRKKYPHHSIDWKKYQQCIHGCDTDYKVATVGRVNMFMETGGTIFDNLCTRDSLYHGLPAENYDIILANMPFGIKGLDYSSCCDRVRDLRIPGKRSEVLFLQLIMVSLKRDGRCAVIVPDGVLVNNIKCHRLTRKMLCENFELEKIIRLSGQFFMNTKIQPSILFFRNSGQGTRHIEFSTLKYNASTNAFTTSNIIRASEKDLFLNEYSLDYRRYKTEATTLPKYQFDGCTNIERSLGDLIEVCVGKGSNHKDVVVMKDVRHQLPLFGTSGRKGFVSPDAGGTHGENLKTGKCTVETSYLIVTRKLNVGHVEYSTDVCTGTDGVLICTAKKGNDQIKLQYLYYWLLFEPQHLQNITNGIKPGIRKSDFLKIKISLPPFSIQKKVCDLLSSLFKTTAQCRAFLKSFLANVDETSPFSSLIVRVLQDLHMGTSVIENMAHLEETNRQTKSIIGRIKETISRCIDHEYITQMFAVNASNVEGGKTHAKMIQDVADINPESIHTYPLDSSFQSVFYADLGCLQDGVLTYRETPVQELPKRAQRRIRANDILWGIVRPKSRNHYFIPDHFDKAQRSKTLVSTGYIVVRIKNNEREKQTLDPLYLYNLLTSNICVQYLHTHSSGTAYPSFTVKTLRQFTIPIPSLFDQQSFNKKIMKYRKQIESLEQIKITF